MNRQLSLAVAAAIVGSGVAIAHPPGTDGGHDGHHRADTTKIRTWTNAKTGEVVRGAFLSARAAGDMSGGVQIGRAHV